MIVRLIVLLFLFGYRGLYAQHISGEIELGGFILGQQREVVLNELGPPIEKFITEDKWIYEFHKFKADTSVYGLFKYPSWDTTRIYAIQVNGERFDEMHPFKGLKLGADKKEIDHILGPVDHTKNVEDPTLVIQYYKHKNYSVEIDQNGKLFGIQIFGSILESNPPTEEPLIHHLHDALVKKNIDSLLRYLSPDVEFHKQGKVIRFTKAARDEFKDTHGEFFNAVLGPTESLWYVFTREFAEGAPDLKADAAANNTIHTFKFFDSAVISEIIFTPHAGRWKVHSVKFRK